MVGRASTLLALGVVAVACGSEFSSADGTGGASSGGSATGAVAGQDASTGGNGETGGAGGGSGQAGSGAVAGQSGSGSGGVAGDGGTVDAPACGTDFVCIPVAPAGWLGPTGLFAASSAPPACSDIQFQGKGGLSCQSAACNCTCSPNTASIDCSPAAMSFWNGGCSSVFKGSSSAELCTAIPAGSTHVNGANAKFTAKCDLTSSSKSIPPETWSTNALACAAGVLPQGCSAGYQCTQKSAAFPLQCIHKAGDAPCPTDSVYSKKRVFFTGHSDTRDCTCQCGNQLGVACNGQLEIHTAASCGSNAQTIAPGSGCTALTGGAVAFKWTFNPSAGTCGGYDTPSGGCAGTGAETFCCTL